MANDHYNTLGIDRNATASDIKKAFRGKAKDTHPDKNGGDDTKFKEVNEAYSVLSDDKKKSNYDNYGSEKGYFNQQNHGGNPFAGGNPFGDFGDFGDIFGNRRQQRQPRTKKGSDLRVTIKVSLKDVLNGVSKDIKIKRKKKCVACTGVGGSDKKTCIQCNGAGVRMVVKNMGFANVQQQVVCNNCEGTGEVIINKCGLCHGVGAKDEMETFHIDVPPGVFEGVVLSDEGNGNYVRGGVYGNLLIQIQEERHPNMVRDGDNLYYNKSISVIDAILGNSLHIEGITKKLKFTIPEGTQSGNTFRLGGEGTPNINSGQRGDIYIKVNVVIPESVNSEEKELINKLRNSKNFEVK